MAEKTTAAKTSNSIKNASPSRTGGDRALTRSPFDRVLTLQQTLGNRAVQQLFKTGKLQAALQIGQPNDVYETETDRTADHIMRMPDPAVQMKPG